MTDWKTYKGQGHWPSAKTASKFGYGNNPRWVPKDAATDNHMPCGYWYDELPYNYTYSVALPSQTYRYVRISADGQYILIGVETGSMDSNGGLYMSQDSGATWSWSIPITANREPTVLEQSTNGKCVVHAQAGNSKTYISWDYGSNWSELRDLGLTLQTYEYAVQAGISANGQYIVLVTPYKYYISSTYGATWSIIPDSVGHYSVLVSGTGQYMEIDGDSLSSNYGSSWTSRASIHNMRRCIDNSGQYRIFGDRYGYEAYGKISYNYGASITNWRTVVTNVWYPDTAVTVSTNGLCMAFVCQNDNTAGNLFISRNGGISFTDTGLGLHTYSLYMSRIAMSSNGQYMAGFIGGKIIVSSNFGVSWTFAVTLTGLSGDFTSDAAMSADGQTQIVIGCGQLYLSGDYGVTWSKQRITLTGSAVKQSVDNAVWPMPA